jgi:peptide deformylase
LFQNSIFVPFAANQAGGGGVYSPSGSCQDRSDGAFLFWSGFFDIIFYMEKTVILTLGNELLRRKAEPVRKIDGSVKKTADEMVEILDGEKGVGLAGPQIGLMKRIFVVHVEGDIPRVFINPSIIETSQDTVKYEEGCLSLPGVWADVIRPKSVKVQAWNEKGRPFTLETAGILARVIQHENDHLEGILFIDRLPEQKRNRALAKMKKAAAKQTEKTRAAEPRG